MTFEHLSKYRKVIIVVAGILIIAGLGLLSAKPKAVDVLPPQDESGIPQAVTMEGEYTCLPPKGDGPHTMECALGIKADNGSYYALDMGGLLYTDQNIKTPTGTRIQISGTLVPIEAISADVWQKYDIKGIVRVEKFIVK